MRVNLLGEERTRLVIRWDEIAVILVVIAALCFASVYYFYLRFQVEQTERQLAAEQEHLASLRTREERYHELRRELESLTMPEDYRLRQPELGSSLEALSEKMPLALSLEELSIEQNEMLLNGHTREVWPLLSLMLSLRESEYYEQVSVEHFQRQDEVHFQITAHLPRRGD